MTKTKYQKVRESMGRELRQRDKQIKELEQEIRLLKIVIAEALEECVSDDIEKATKILEEYPKTLKQFEALKR